MRCGFLHRLVLGSADNDRDGLALLFHDDCLVGVIDRAEQIGEVGAGIAG